MKATIEPTTITYIDRRIHQPVELDEGLVLSEGDLIIFDTRVSGQGETKPRNGVYVIVKKQINHFFDGENSIIRYLYDAQRRDD